MQIQCLANCTHTTGGVERAYNKGNLYDVDDELGAMLLAFPANFQNPGGGDESVASSQPSQPAKLGPEEVDLDSLSNAELRDMADRNDVNLTRASSRAEMIELIRTAYVARGFRSGAGTGPGVSNVIGPDFDGDITAPGGDRLTMADLREIAKGFGVDVSHIERKADLIALLKTAGHEVKVDATVEDDDDAEDDGVESLDTLTVAELREVADDEDVDLTGITLKSDIVAAIEKGRE